MGFSGSGGLAASSSNCCCGRRRGEEESESQRERQPSPSTRDSLRCCDRRRNRHRSSCEPSRAASGRSDGEREEGCGQKRSAGLPRPRAGGLVLFGHRPEEDYHPSAGLLERLKARNNGFIRNRTGEPQLLLASGAAICKGSCGSARVSNEAALCRQFSLLVLRSEETPRDDWSW